MNDIEVRLLIPATDVIGLPHPASLKHTADRGCVILYVEPVAHLLTIAVNREGLAGESVVDHKRDELLGEVVGAVIVGAVRREDG